MIVLAIDAAASIGTVAVIRDGTVIADDETAMRGADQERLLPTIDRVLTRSGASVRDVGRIVCGAGPGSFTSLRIAASLAKGIAMGAVCPLFAVSSLALVVASLSELRPGRYVGVLDALRGECYAASFVVAATGEVSAAGEMRLVAASELGAFAVSEGARLVGAGHAGGGRPHARGAARLESLYLAQGPVDLARWEPEYGRKAEAQVRWEAAQGRPLPT